MDSSKVTVGIGKLPMKLQSSQNRLFIKGGTIVNADCMNDADIYVEDGVIKQIGHNLIVPGGCRVIDAKGLLVMPGGIDTHTHMQMPFMGTFSCDDFYSGTRAALYGGTTMIIDFVVSERGESLLQSFDQYRAWADAKVCCDYALHVIVPHFNEQTASEMAVLVKEKGVNSFKAFMAYAFKLEDDELYALCRAARELGALVQVHAENGKLVDKLATELFESGITGPEGHYYSRPTVVETEATERAITIAGVANCPLYVVHVMSQSAAAAVAAARRNGQVVFGESIAAGLALDGSHYFHSCWQHSAGYVMSPPLRTEPNNAECLMKLLANGDLECTGTDHCVFRTEQKAVGKDDFRKIPNGVNGVEERMSIVWQNGVLTGLMDACKFVAVTSTNAAKVFNIYPKKGCIAVGSDADIVVWNPDGKRTFSKDTHHQNVDFNVFEGMTCQGVPRVVIMRGSVVYDNENGEDLLKVTQGHGKYVDTPNNCRYVFGLNAIKEKIRTVKPTERDSSSGQVPTSREAVPGGSDVTKNDTDSKASDFHNRPPTSSGARNMQDSTFALSGHQVDDTHRVHTSIKTRKPPGGESSRPW